MLPFLPYGRQTIEDDDVAEVVRALHAELLTTGPEVARFETAFAGATGAAHAVACNSGTAALHLALLGIELGPADAAIVPAITFLATANAARMCGAEVVFADVDADSGLLTAETLAAAIGRAKALGLNPVAALPVHLNGRICDLEALAAVAGAHGIALVEDSCHALGVEGVGASPHTRAACFSTHPVKAIATGEGGVVTTRDSALAARMRRLRNHGMERNADHFVDRTLSTDADGALPWAYEMPEIGWNYRLPDVLCALGTAQLGKLARFQARRRAIARLYDELLDPLAPVLRPVAEGPFGHGRHLYAVLIDFPAAGLSRAALMRALAVEDRIGTQVHYIPVPCQPYYRSRYGTVPLPGADTYYARCLSLPFYPSMSDGDVERVAATLARRLGV